MGNSGLDFLRCETTALPNTSPPFAGKSVSPDRLQGMLLGLAIGDADPSARMDLSKTGVGGLVTGTYLPSGSGVLISARLIQVKDGAVLAADNLSVALDRATRGLIDREFSRFESKGTPVKRLKRHLLDAGVFYEAPNERGYPVKDGMTLYEGDNYRLYFKPNRRAYVYVIQVDSGGAVFRLFPNTEGKFGYRTIGNPVSAGTAVWAPPHPKFLYLDENKGREEIYFFATERAIEVFEASTPLTGKSVRRAIKLMGVKGTRLGKATVEIKTADGEILYTLTEAKVLVQRWRQLYNRVRHHSALGYRPAAPETIEPLTPGFPELLDIGEQSTNSKNGTTLGGRSPEEMSKGRLQFRVAEHITRAQQPGGLDARARQEKGVRHLTQRKPGRKGGKRKDRRTADNAPERFGEFQIDDR